MSLTLEKCKLWVATELWNIEDAANLSTGIDPNESSEGRCSEIIGTDELVYNAVQIVRQCFGDHIPEWQTPAEWVQMFLQAGLTFPPMLLEAFSQEKYSAFDLQKPKMPDEAQTPWLIANERDPKPEQLWYTPARYFARQLVKDDSTLLVKRLLLSEKIAQSLCAVGARLKLTTCAR